LEMHPDDCAIIIISHAFTHLIERDGILKRIDDNNKKRELKKKKEHLKLLN
jgi:hypothetical protein